MNTNSLSSIQHPAWVGDGPNGTLQTNENILNLTALKQGTPYNIRLDDASIPPSSFYYEIEIMELSASIAVGVVKQEQFQPGWKTKGMFFNGNVTNGSAGLIIGFGESPKKGDTVGVYVQRDSNGLSVVFYLNGRCLGKAFSLNDVDSSDILYPCLHISEQVVVKYSAPDTLPSVTIREQAIYDDVYSGEWKLIRAFAGPELGEFPLPSDHDILFTLKKRADGYTLMAHVVNSFSTILTLQGKRDGFDRIEVSDMTSTMMMPFPPLDTVEDYISSSLPTLYQMTVNDNLIMTGPTAELILERYCKTFQTLKKY